MYPEFHDSLDVVEHLCDVGEAGEAVVGAVVAAHDPSATPALPRVSLHSVHLSSQRALYV